MSKHLADGVCRGCVTLLVAGAAFPAQSSGQTTQFDFCRAATAGMEIRVTSGTPSVEADDSVGSYFGAGCNRFVVDILIPALGKSSAASAPSLRLRAGTFRLPGGHPVGERFTAPGSEVECESYTQLTTIYKRPAGEKEFTRLSAVTTKGDWQDAACALRIPEWGYDPPTKGGDTYRVAAGVRVNQRWRPVRVTAAH